MSGKGGGVDNYYRFGIDVRATLVEVKRPDYAVSVIKSKHFGVQLVVRLIFQQLNILIQILLARVIVVGISDVARIVQRISYYCELVVFCRKRA